MSINYDISQISKVAKLAIEQNIKLELAEHLAIITVYNYNEFFEIEL